MPFSSPVPETEMPAEAAVVHDIAEVIRNGQEFVIAGHLRPDGDCLGSCLGLYELLRTMGKRVRFYTAGPVPDVFHYLPNIDKVELEMPRGGSPDATLVVDSSGPDRVHEDFNPDGFVVNIDHHVTNTQFGRLNWVDPEATAAAEQIYRLAMVLGQPITPEIATCLYTGIMTDTGGFRFSNTDQMTFQAAGHLVRSGANPAAIAQEVWETRKRGAVKLTGEVYASIKFEFDGLFAWNEVTQEMYARCGGEVEPEGLSSDLRGIEGVEIAVLFFETPENQMRVGFRSKGKVNVSELAQLLGGGGHVCASGAMIREPYPQARERALGVIRQYLAEKV